MGRRKIITLHATPASASLYLFLRRRFKIIKQNQEHDYEIVGYSTDSGIGNKDGYAGAFEKEGFDYYESKYLTRDVSIVRDIKYFFESYFLFKRIRPVIVNTYGPKPGLYARLAAWFAGVPVIVHTSWGLFFNEDSSNLRKSIVILIEKILARFCSYLYSENIDDFNVMIKYKFKSEDSIGYLGNGTDVQNVFNPELFSTNQVEDEREKYGIDKHSIVVGTVGRLSIGKGYRELFDAAKRIRKRYSNVEFVVIGHYDFRRCEGISEVEMEELQKENIIKYLGVIDHDKMPLFYSMMDIFVLASWREGFPNSLLEAASMGKPLVSSDIRGSREIVVDGYNGILFPAKNTGSLYESICKLVDDNDLRIEMGKNSRIRAEAELDERKIVNKVMSVYEKLLSEHGFN